jgi:hypothetical protein
LHRLLARDAILWPLQVCQSRKQPYFCGSLDDTLSSLVLGVTGSILTLYAAIGFLVARLIGGDWRTVLMVFILESWPFSRSF